VLRALVASAFAQEPSSQVEISVEPEEKAVRIKVLDRGAGGAQQERKHVFDWMASSDDATGASLSLSVARGLARAMGGDVTLVSRPGGGSELSFTLGRSGRSS
jgi:signal transduction histidine kinase